MFLKFSTQRNERPHNGLERLERLNADLSKILEVKK